MGTLIVYFTLEGNTEFIAQQIARAINADTVALTTSKTYPTEGLKKYLWGGKSVFFNEMPPLTNPRIDINRYDTIFIGTPIWAGTYAPPIKTFLNDYQIAGKRIALFACHGGGGADKCLSKLKQALERNMFIGKIDFKDPKTDPETNAQKAVNWASSLTK